MMIVENPIHLEPFAAVLTTMDGVLHMLWPRERSCL